MPISSSRTNVAGVATFALAAGVLVNVHTCPAQRPDGTFALVSIDGGPLPARVTEIPTRDGRGSGCYLEISAGWLTLDLRGGTFSMGARERDTCGVTSFGGDTSATGRYAWRGGRPHLVVQPGDSPAQEFPVRLTQTTIEVSDTYTHRRYRYRWDARR